MIFRQPRSTNVPPRRAAIAVDFLLAFPVALGMVFAIAEFGILFAKVQYVEVAAFEGAAAAARLESNNAGQGAAAARWRANRVLREAGLGNSCAVVVRYHSAGRFRQASTNTNCVCEPPRLPRRSNITAVQCTVCVRMSQLTPDLLSLIGFSTEGRIVSASHTVPELRKKESSP